MTSAMPRLGVVVALLPLVALACGSPRTSQPATSTTRAAATANRSTRPTPVVPVFESGLPPGEGIPVVEALRTQLPLRASPNATARVVHTLTVKAGDRLTYDATRYQTVRGGEVRVRAAASVEGRNLGATRYLSRDQYYTGSFRDTVIELNPPATIQYLQYRAEGTCFVRVGTRVIDADPCPIQDSTKFALREQPKTLWWIRVTTATGPSGWLLLTDSTARVVDRTF